MGEGGHWNRAGRRSGGWRPVPLLVGSGKLRCEVPGCAAEVAVMGVLAEDGSEHPFCQEHFDMLKASGDSMGRDRG